MSAGKVAHLGRLCQLVPGSDREIAPGHSQRVCGWSKAFKCPDCGARRRCNTNFLGSRHVVCKGTKIMLIADRFADLRDAGVDFAREAAR